MFKGVSDLTKELDVLEKEIEGKKKILETLENDKLSLDKYKKEKEALLGHLSTLREQIRQEQTALDKLLYDKISLQNEISELKRKAQKVASEVSQKEKHIDSVDIGFSSDTENKVEVTAKNGAKSGLKMDVKTDVLLSNGLVEATRPETAFDVEKLYKRLAKFEYKIKRLEKRLIMVKPGSETSSSEVFQPDGTVQHSKGPENVEQTCHQKVLITSHPDKSTLKKSKFRRKEGPENLIAQDSESDSSEELEDLRLYKVISEGEWRPEDKARNFITKEESRVELLRGNVTLGSPHLLQHYKNYHERMASDLEKLQKVAETTSNYATYRDTIVRKALLSTKQEDCRKRLLKELTSTPLQTERIHPGFSLSRSSSISDCSSGISGSDGDQLAPCLGEHQQKDPPGTSSVPSLGLPYVSLSQQLTQRGKDGAVPAIIADQRSEDTKSVYGSWTLHRSSSVDRLLGQAWKECFGDCLAPVLPRPASGAEAINYSQAHFNQSISSNSGPARDLCDVQSSHEMWRVKLREMRKKTQTNGN
ncbi:uncharacterized protein LOC106468579 [Limulus polyphemus]|uniref:Uncharacterized protein LOC106468579 n=1 Tax=Limulus polyphemus TaxID=6850 RepID=A0ABM1BLL2_LIMPO|nr:uncharacterized protein LOC106468579 [Limulus polyphemus]